MKRLPVTQFIHLITSEMARRVPATSPGFLNRLTVTSDCSPPVGCVTATVVGSDGREATCSRLSWNGSMVASMRNGNAFGTLSAISSRRSASHSPRPDRSRADMAMSMLVLNWISRSRGSSTAPSRMPENVTPKRCSKVSASATKYGAFIFIS